ncbi:hypothetical protein VTJ04DRAFT_4159 [Mycothermus thermophilus]|uniref:uncharacterized protein n=1 Tax=Humicola insolens TaxID=85995 RepID=UPI0037449CE6
MTIKIIRNLATQVLHTKKDFDPLGQNWHQHFLRRHNQKQKDAIDYDTLKH